LSSFEQKYAHEIQKKFDQKDAYDITILLKTMVYEGENGVGLQITSATQRKM